jgi:hypothetical protein
MSLAACFRCPRGENAGVQAGRWGKWRRPAVAAVLIAALVFGIGVMLRIVGLALRRT